MSHDGAGKRKKKREDDGLFGGRILFKIAGQFAILYLEHTLPHRNLIPTLRQKKYSHESDLGTIASDTIILVRANQGDGRDGMDRTATTNT